MFACIPSVILVTRLQYRSWATGRLLCRFWKVSTKFRIYAKSETLCSVTFRSFQTTDPIFCMDISATLLLRRKLIRADATFGRIIIIRNGGHIVIQVRSSAGLNKLYPTSLLLFKAWHSAFMLYESRHGIRHECSSSHCSRITPLNMPYMGHSKPAVSRQPGDRGGNS